MRRRMFEMQCPHCHHSFMMMQDTFLKKDERSKEYKRLKDQTFFSHQCQHCKKLFLVSWPLCYWDEEKDFAILLTNKEKPDELPCSRTVITHDPHQFLLGFQALDINAPLSEVIILQKEAERKKGEPVYLLDWNSHKNAALFQSGADIFWVVSHKPAEKNSGKI